VFKVPLTWSLQKQENRGSGTPPLTIPRCKKGAFKNKNKKKNFMLPPLTTSCNIRKKIEEKIKLSSIIVNNRV